jgi:hypothetical protein
VHLELAQAEPQLLSRRHSWSRLSKIQLAMIVACWSKFPG